MTDSERLTYLRNGELREEIVYAVGGDPTRYGPNSKKGLTKADMIRIATQLQPEGDGTNLRECTIGTLYELACEWAGGAYRSHTGNPWKIDRENLKKIHHAVGGRSPRKVIVHA